MILNSKKIMRDSAITAALLMSAQIALAQSQQTCQALVQSGGGSNGAWEAGVIWGLSHYGNEEDFYYDWVTGVSAGSINTLMEVGWAPNEVVEMSEWVSYQMSPIRDKDLFSPWEGGFPDWDLASII